MEPSYFELGGAPVASDDLVIQRARELTQWLLNGDCPYVVLVECRRYEDGREVVVFDLSSTVPSRPVIDIRVSERIAICFGQDDNVYPEIRALRLDFPREDMMHVIPVPEYEPVALCVFIEPWLDIKLRINALGLVYRIQFWLSETAAKGNPHGSDQPIEPMFLGPAPLLVISPRIFERISAGDTTLKLGLIPLPNGEFAAVEARTDRIKGEMAKPALIVTAASKPHTHSLVTAAPSTLADLHKWLERVELDVLGAVQKALLEKQLANQLGNYGNLVLLFSVLRRREKGDEPVPRLVAFLAIGSNPNADSLQNMASMVGLSGTGNGDSTGRGIPVQMMDVRFELTPESAAHLSGVSQRPERLVGLGVGALGSQIVFNSVRSGMANWTLVDEDILLPHNLVRHGLTGVWIGHPKSHALMSVANSLLDEPKLRSIQANMVTATPEMVPDLFGAYTEADAIVDMSASVAVARHIVHHVDSTAPRCSLFLSPSGNDLVFLAEDRARKYRLDDLEAQYYRAVAALPELQGHLGNARYAGSCRDVTSQVSQDLMGLHAAQATRLLRKWLDMGSQSSVVMRFSPETGEYRAVQIPVAETIEIGDLDIWSLRADKALLEELARQRSAALPNETGGVLLGHIDQENKVIYVCHQIPAPVDSERQPTMYIRGSTGLKSAYKAIREATLNGLTYLGEWHAHPDGYTCSPSKDDLVAGAWLAEKTRVDAQPGLMLIVGDKGQTAWILCTKEMDEPYVAKLTITRTLDISNKKK